MSFYRTFDEEIDKMKREAEEMQMQTTKKGKD